MPVKAHALAIAGQLVGFGLASFGLVRESFARTAERRPFGEGRFGEGCYGGVASRATEILLSCATWARLLPTDRVLTITDHKRNAALAIVGVMVGAAFLLFELGLSFAVSP